MTTNDDASLNCGEWLLAAADRSASPVRSHISIFCTSNAANPLHHPSDD